MQLVTFTCFPDLWRRLKAAAGSRGASAALREAIELWLEQKAAA
jgi:hypothetical protein